MSYTMPGKKIFSVLLFFLAYSLAGGQPQISLSVEKSRLVLREPIWITVDLTNSDSTSYHYFVFSATDDIKIILKDEQGKELQYDGLLITYAPMPWRELKPGEKVSKTENLLEFYGKRDFEWPNYKYLPAGRYTLQVCLKFKEEERVCSNIERYEVVEPQGIAKVQHDLLVEARKAFLVGNNTKRSVSLHDEIISRQPQSTYSELAYSELIRLLSISDQAAKIPRSKEFIFSFPQSHFIEGEVESVYSDYMEMGKQDTARKFIEEIVERFADTRAGKAAKKLLESEKQ